MNRTLDRLGRFAATHPWRTFAVWLVLAVAVFGVAGAVGGQTQEDWDVPAAPAQRGVDLLREHLPASGNTSAQVVVHDDAPAGRLRADCSHRPAGRASTTSSPSPRRGCRPTATPR